MKGEMLLPIIIAVGGFLGLAPPVLLGTLRWLLGAWLETFRPFDWAAYGLSLAPTAVYLLLRLAVKDRQGWNAIAAVWILVLPGLLATCLDAVPATRVFVPLVNVLAAGLAVGMWWLLPAKHMKLF